MAKAIFEFPSEKMALNAWRQLRRPFFEPRDVVAVAENGNPRRLVVTLSKEFLPEVVRICNDRQGKLIEES